MRRNQQELARLTTEISDLEAMLPTLEHASTRTRLEAAAASAALSGSGYELRIHGEEVRRLHEQANPHIEALGLTGPATTDADSSSSSKQQTKRKDSTPANNDAADQPPTAGSKAKTQRRDQKG